MGKFEEVYAINVNDKIEKKEILPTFLGRMRGQNLKKSTQTLPIKSTSSTARFVPATKKWAIWYRRKSPRIKRPIKCGYL